MDANHSLSAGLHWSFDARQPMKQEWRTERCETQESFLVELQAIGRSFWHDFLQTCSVTWTRASAENLKSIWVTLPMLLVIRPALPPVLTASMAILTVKMLKSWNMQPHWFTLGYTLKSARSSSRLTILWFIQLSKTAKAKTKGSGFPSSPPLPVKKSKQREVRHLASTAHLVTHDSTRLDDTGCLLFNVCFLAGLGA